MANRVNDVLSDEEIVRLVDNEGMGYKEIAEQIGFHHKTIYKHYRAGKEKLEERQEAWEQAVTYDEPLPIEHHDSEESDSWWEKFLDFFGLF